MAPIQNGFETYIVAGLQKKEVPLVVVVDRTKADYELTGVSGPDKAGWAKMLILGSQNTNESASIKIVNLRTGSVVFGYSVNKTNSARGKQSAGEAVAKHIKEKIKNAPHRRGNEPCDFKGWLQFCPCYRIVAAACLAFGQDTASNAIPIGSKVYIAPMEDGFQDYLKVAIQKKKVPLTAACRPSSLSPAEALGLLWRRWKWPGLRYTHLGLQPAEVLGNVLGQLGSLQHLD